MVGKSLRAICVSAALCLVFGKSVLAATYSAYVMGYFKESPNGSTNSAYLQLAVSMDGLTWVPLNQNTPVMKPTMGTKVLRDPFLYRMPDGSFTIVATDNWNSEYIHIWSSPDLRTFTDERLVRMNSTGMHSWAPEIFYDEGKTQYAIIWSGNTDRNRIYVSYTTDFKTVTPAAVFFDPGFSVIDGHMEVGIGGYNYLYFKDERDWKLYGTRSTSLAARSFDANKFTTGHGAPFNGSHTEAPILIKSLTSNNWWLWGDSYNPINAVFYSWEASDLNTKTWTVLGRRDYTAPPNAKHATIVPITATELSNLLTKWGKPNFDLIKSYRIPTAYVRNATNVAKISNYPFDPVATMQWKVVPGLADPTGVSFESVSSPNNYLRQSNNVVGVAVNDNSTTFKSNATFYKTVGFAKSDWSSLKSHAVPDRYLRQQADSTLRLDPITTASSATDKEDATFQIVYASVNFDPPASVSPTRQLGTPATVRFEARARHAEVVYQLDQAKQVKLDIVDLQGRSTTTLFEGIVPAGSHDVHFSVPSTSTGLQVLRLAIEGNAVVAQPVVMP